MKTIEPRMIYLQHPSQLFAGDNVLFAYNGKNRFGEVVRVAPQYFTMKIDSVGTVRTFRFDKVQIMLHRVHVNPYGIQIHNA